MKIVIGITGASGSIYAATLLMRLQTINQQNNNLTVAILISENAKTVWQYELDNKDYEKLPFKCYSKQDFMAPFASGSGGYEAMIICPCSMGTLGRIAAGVSDDLMTRSADVVLKERRRLILVVRETPYSLIHLQNMKTLTEAGAIICPATPSFYSKPQTIEALTATVTDRALELAGIRQNDTYRWGQ